MSNPEPEVVEEYSHDFRIVREVDAGVERYHYEGLRGRLQSFHDLEKARLYADVYTVMNGFREEKSGERGVPIQVALAREDVLIAYLAAQPTRSVEWVSRQSEVSEEQIRQYIQMVRRRAEEKRAEND